MYINIYTGPGDKVGTSLGGLTFCLQKIYMYKMFMYDRTTEFSIGIFYIVLLFKKCSPKLNKML